MNPLTPILHSKTTVNSIYTSDSKYSDESSINGYLRINN